jgi:hypothetical protein
MPAGDSHRNLETRLLPHLQIQRIRRYCAGLVGAGAGNDGPSGAAGAAAFGAVGAGAGIFGAGVRLGASILAAGALGPDDGLEPKYISASRAASKTTPRMKGVALAWRSIST